MSVNPTSAIAAYAKTLAQGKAPGLEARDSSQNFAGMVNQAVGSLRQGLAASETASANALTGKADLTGLVTSVANAELMLQTVVSVRDKAIQAYQEILRMPI
ncbi:MAG: flagellar hook-basal body complex protein FliE [Alphaproteobacteria bacterium]